MDTELLSKSALLGLIEGLTEFLPISSTGHLILAGDLMNYTGDKAKLFTIVIQVGAILAICWEYRKKIFSVLSGLFNDTKSQKFIFNLAIAFLPLASLGVLFGSQIKSILFKPIPVALAFIVGAFVIIWAEKREHKILIYDISELKPLDSFKLGIAQAFALIPGTSRSGATIIGGLLLGLSRKAATEFSFFLAIPTLFIASLYDLYKHRELLMINNDLISIIVGMTIAFFSALIAVKALLKFISHHDFILFAWYRIFFGILVLITAYSDTVHWTIN
jgi:undecaprenyl-diphosphatase